ncbi:Sodium/potassium-transporting ATPase subunit alpha-B [Halotydeus destructor]|nr:Sodium/potassium-transporting ATPase subunit alpha-B [Halotydeus destructor]
MEPTVGNVMQYRAKNKKICEILYNSTNKFHVTIHEAEDPNDGYLLCIKGAPERILERSGSIYLNGKDVSHKLRERRLRAMKIWVK